MAWERPKWCMARMGDVLCELRFGHAGPHRCETGPPVLAADGTLTAQITAWN